VATLLGIVRAAYTMPDVRWGYSFPIGGVGFDISCSLSRKLARLLPIGVVKV
jgi:tRNA-splicing ligase RtcB